jgi:hypothetical protein
MSVLSVCREAAVKLNQTRPASIFSSTDSFALELSVAANEAARAVMKAKEWNKLKTLATMTGDASTTSFALPADYDRMLVKGKVHSANWQNASFVKADDEDDWLYSQDLELTGNPGKWIILGGRFQVFPAMSASETARFYYISKYVVALTGSTTGSKATFTTDTDEFILSEEVLKLGIIWRWRANKRQEYAEDMTNFEIAIAEEMGADKGSNILTIGRRRMPAEASLVYPGTIVP